MTEDPIMAPDPLEDEYVQMLEPYALNRYRMWRMGLLGTGPMDERPSGRVKRKSTPTPKPWTSEVPKR